MILNKRMLLLFLSMGLFSATMAQLKPKSKCPDFNVDILNGTVNGLKPTRTVNEISAEFPCSTSVEEEGSNAKCGAGVFFKDKDIFFYTKRSYIEIGPKFKGKLSLPLLGAKRNSLFKWLGNPKMKDDLWDAFQMQYGTLVLHYDIAGVNGKVKLFQFSTLGVELLDLCE